MKDARKHKIILAVGLCLGGGSLAATLTHLITRGDGYSFQFGIFFVSFCFFGSLLFIFWRYWVGAWLNGKWGVLLQLALSLGVGLLIVWMTPLHNQVYTSRLVELEIRATSQSNPLATGNEIGILSVTLDDKIIPWSEFSWQGNWDKIGDRPYFHNTEPATLIWRGIANQGSLSLLLYAHPSSGIVKINWNDASRTIDLFEDSEGSFVQVDFPVFKKDWLWVLYFLSFSISIGVLVFIVVRYFTPNKIGVMLIMTVFLNLSLFQIDSPLPRFRLLPNNKLDQVAVVDKLWAINDGYMDVVLAVYLYPSLRDSTIIFAPELLAELKKGDFPSEEAAYSWEKFLVLQDYKIRNYDFMLTREEEERLVEQPFQYWNFSQGRKMVVLSGNRSDYVLMKYNTETGAIYYFVPMDLVNHELDRVFDKDFNAIP